MKWTHGGLGGVFLRNKIFNVSEPICDLFEKSPSAYMADFQLHDSQVHREKKKPTKKINERVYWKTTTLILATLFPCIFIKSS